MRSKKAINNIVTSLLLQFITIICGFIVPKLIIQSYGSNVNGLITSITQFLAYITLLESGFGPVVKSILYKPIAKNNKTRIEEILKASEKFFRTISYIFIIYIVVLSIILPFMVLNEFNYLFTLSLIIIIAISTFAEYYFGMTYRLFLQAEQKTYVISIIQIGTIILNTIMIVILIKFKINIQIVKLTSTIIFVLRPILQNVYVKRKYNLSLKNVKSDFKIKQKWDGLAQHVAYVIHSNTDIAILTIFSTTLEVSVYSIYLLILNGVKGILNTLSSGIEALFGDMIAKNENSKLNKSFKLYEIIYHTITSIIFNCTIVLIVPFVTIYTKNITDQNYIRPFFAMIFTLAEFICMIRLPYVTITHSAGHFKETRLDAWIEALTNIIISLILVFKFGINGIAVGTFIAMLFRTIRFMHHTSKKILNRKSYESFKWLIIIGIETIIFYVLTRFLCYKDINNYWDWIKYAIISAVLSSVIVISTNTLIFRKNIVEVKNIIKNSIYKRRKNESNRFD